MRLKFLVLMCAPILLCLPAAAPANAARSFFACSAEGSSFSASITHKVGRNSADLSDAETSGPFTAEQSTELLLLIGVGLIAGASLIGVKLGRSDSVEEVENSGEAAILSKPARSFYGSSTSTMARMPTTSKRGTADVKQMRTQPLRRLSSNGMGDQGQRNNSL
jgi:hypothetical protein